MSKLYLKAPDGRIVPAPRGVTVSRVVNDEVVTVVNDAALKVGWSLATEVDIAAKSPAATPALSSKAAKSAEKAS